uniref:Constans-like protein n=1 Tax=Phyllostachys edulis TaxID=38705 RepID=A0A3Q8B7T7_PHYED|nr:constans-like protein [Phyllostachys edulis]
MMELGVGRYWGLGGRRCGACGGSPAAVHCRTCAGGGGGYLCAGCDAEHARAGHERVWVCEVCELAPASVTCRADAAALCAACDADIHDANPLARRHERVPVQPIGSAPAAAGAEDALRFGGPEGDKDGAAVSLDVVDGGGKDVKLDFLFADVMDPFLGSEVARFSHTDSVVPNNGSSAGGNGGAVELDFGGAAAVAKPSYSSYTAASLGHSGSSSEVGLVPDAICGRGGGIIELDFAHSKAAYLPYVATPSHSVSSVDVGAVPERSDGAAAGKVATTGEGREARLMRYREKRKNRRFEKTIRYASRKAYAESRPRIKGRFAKRADDADAEDAASAAPQPYMLDFGGYGVVPAF